MGNSCIKTKDRGLFNINTGEVKTDNVRLIKWKATYKTSKYHWWPLLKKYENDAINNLYAVGGGLSKYDMLFNTKSIQYQIKNYMIPKDSDRKDKNWAGFCDKATILSCLYEYPNNEVCVNYKSQTINFTQRDIEMLMIIAAENAIKHGCFLFLGKRYNDKKMYGDDKNEPYPLDLLKMLKTIVLEDEPFAIDIDNGTSVWNYSFDDIEVNKSYTCPLEHTKPTLNFIEYYNFKIKSKAYPE